MPTLGLKLRLNRITARILRVITDGLVLWQKMVPSPWTGSARMIDASGTGNDGDLYTGRTMAFDGTNDVITIGDTSQNVKTVVFWVWPDTTTEKFMQLQASGAVDIGMTSGTLSGTGWTSPTYYVNGVAGTSVSSGAWQMIAVTSATAIDASDVRLGLSNATYFDGKLSNVIFFGSELTANQMAQLYALPESPIPSGLGAGDIVGWWTLAESTAPGIALDGSGNNNNGAISGASDLLAQNGAVPQWGFKGNSWPMYWDDSNDYISANSIAASTQFSVSFWLTKNSGGLGYIFWWETTNDDFGILLNFPLNEIRIGWLSNALTKGNFVLKNKIMHIVATLDTSTLELKLYRNGAIFSTDTLSAGVWGTTNFYWLGGSSFTHDSIIFNHGYWDSILSANEVAALYAAGIDHDLRITTGNYTSTANLKAYFVNTGNQNSDWTDLSGNGNNGTVNGTPGRIFLPEGLTPGKDVVGMTVDNPVNGEMYGEDVGYISVTDDASLDITTAISIEAWVKPEIVNALQSIVAKQDAYQLEVTSAGKPSFSYWSSSTENANATTSTTLTAGQWAHIAITYDGTNVKIYINGSLDTTAADTGTIDTNSNACIVGAATTSTEQFTGYIDDVRIYNVALTADQVANNYNATKASHSN